MGKLIKNGREYGGVVVDTALDTTSTNPVQNKVVANAINQINTHLSAFKTFPASAVTAIAPDGNQFAPSTSTVTWKWCTGSNGQVYLCAYVDGTFVEAFRGFLQFESTNKHAVGHD